MFDDQTKIKFQYNGKLGRTIDFMLRPLGNQEIIVTNILVEVCAEPISGKLSIVLFVYLLFLCGLTSQSTIFSHVEMRPRFPRC